MGMGMGMGIFHGTKIKNLTFFNNIDDKQLMLVPQVAPRPRRGRYMGDLRNYYQATIHLLSFEQTLLIKNMQLF